MKTKIFTSIESLESFLKNLSPLNLIHLDTTDKTCIVLVYKEVEERV